MPYISQFSFCGPKITKCPRNDGSCFSIVKKQIITDVECPQEHETQNHTNIPIKLLEIFLSLFVGFIQAFGSSNELNYHFVVQIVQLPCISTGILGVVIISKNFLLNVIDVQLARNPLVRFICLELICDDICSQLVFVHCLYLLIEDSRLTLDRFQFIIVPCWFTSSDIVFLSELEIPNVAMQS